MLRFAKGTLRRLSANIKARAPKRIAGLRRRAVRLTGALQSKDQANQFLGCVRDGDVIVFALSTLLGEVSGERTVPDADVLSSIEECVTKIPRAALLHMSIGVVQFAGLIGRR